MSFKDTLSVVDITRAQQQGSHRLEKYLNLEGFLEKKVLEN